MIGFISSRIHYEYGKKRTIINPSLTNFHTVFRTVRFEKKNLPAVYNHFLLCSYLPSFDNFTYIKDFGFYLLKLREFMSAIRDKQSSNKDKNYLRLFSTYY